MVDQSIDDEFTMSGDATESQLGRHFGRAHKSSYSLLLLFYLTTVAAILVAACRMAFTAKLWTWNLFFVGYVGASGWLLVLSTMIGYAVCRKPWGIAIGIVVGLLGGLLAILMVLIQAEHYLNASLILGGGSWILALVAVVANRNQYRTSGT